MVPEGRSCDAYVTDHCWFTVFDGVIGACLTISVSKTNSPLLRWGLQGLQCILNTRIPHSIPHAQGFSGIQQRSTCMTK
jgi:hypothetical protein